MHIPAATARTMAAFKTNGAACLKNDEGHHKQQQEHLPSHSTQTANTVRTPRSQLRVISIPIGHICMSVSLVKLHQSTVHFFPSLYVSVLVAIARSGCCCCCCCCFWCWCWYCSSCITVALCPPLSLSFRLGRFGHPGGFWYCRGLLTIAAGVVASAATATIIVVFSVAIVVAAVAARIVGLFSASVLLWN